MQEERSRLPPASPNREPQLPKGLGAAPAPVLPPGGTASWGRLASTAHTLGMPCCLPGAQGRAGKVLAPSPGKCKRLVLGARCRAGSAALLPGLTRAASCAGLLFLLLPIHQRIKLTDGEFYHARRGGNDLWRGFDGEGG